MTDTPRPGRDQPSSSGGREEQPQGSDYPGYGYPGYSDPAYASQAYGPTYQAPAGPAPTERLPSYGAYGYDPYATGQYGAPYPSGEPSSPPPEEPKSPRWLWIAAGLAVLTVIGLVIALVVVNSSQQQTVVAPPPAQEPDFTTPFPTTTIPPTVPRTTRPRAPGVPTVPSTPRTTTPGVTQSVVYVVGGTGRAINITYVDTGGLLQTEFNVLLPWSKEVELSESVAESASVSIINVGREVNCSITVDGAVVQQRTGAGLTICTASG